MKLKYIFKITRETWLRDIIQFFFIFLLIVIFLLELLIGILIFCVPHGCGTEMRPAVKKAFSSANQALKYNKEREGSNNYDNIDDFARIFAKSMSVIDVKYLDVTLKNRQNYNGRTLIDTKIYTKDNKFSSKEIKNYNLKEYEGKPILIIADGMLYMFTKFEKGCNKVDIEEVENSSCLIDVDVNGIKKHNRKKFDPKNPNATDRYTIIVDGNNDKIVSPKIYETLIYGKKLED